MIDYPQTLAEAEAVRYSRWGGNPKGNPFDPKRCAYQVFPQGRGQIHHQCIIKPGKGPGGLYCGIHAKKAEARKSA